MKRRKLIQTSGLFAAGAIAGPLVAQHKAKANPSINVGVNHQIHVANDTSEEIYVLPAPNPDWVWGDLGFDIATSIIPSLFTGGAATAAGVAKATTAVRSLTTFQTILKQIQLIWQMTSGIRTVASQVGIAYNVYKVGREELRDQARKAQFELKSFLQENAVSIPAGDYKRIFDRWSPTRFITLSDISSMFNSSNITLFVTNKSLSKIAKFNTNSDSSWILNGNEVVRAKYGSLWQEDRGAGFYRFSMFDTLPLGLSLSPNGDSLSSANGDYDFVYHGDGNAVVYKRDKPRGESVIWSSNTKNSNPGPLFVDQYGNLIIQNANNENLLKVADKASGTETRTKLTMQDNGDVVIRDEKDSVTWNSY
ncbi:MAG: hypothetical protein WBG73_09055 [Coleofasciculaceae cyanobacterium]